MPVRLTVLSGPLSGQLIEINQAKYLIGREEDCDLRPDSRLVSRHHCAFLQDGYTVRLRDMGSRNGTFVNGNRINGTVTLNAGDLISIGESTLKCDISPVSSTGSETAPAKGPNAAMSQTDVFDGETLQGQIAAFAGSKTPHATTPKLPVAE
jgi:pSer/pThr/pTyr-binding forkhead associated (FHA) protein